MNKERRHYLVSLYIRICRDSNFTLSMVDAARTCAKLEGIAPLEFWIAVGSIEDMQKIANGTHLCLKLEMYNGLKQDFNSQAA